jgi:hypothetical protein
LIQKAIAAFSPGRTARVKAAAAAGAGIVPDAPLPDAPFRTRASIAPATARG